MKGIIRTSSLLLFFVHNAFSATEVFKIDPNHTSVTWQTSHFGFSNPSGKFNKIDGTISLDESDLSKTKVNVKIQMDGLVTGIEKFDTHLKSKDFFDATKFPISKFESSEIKIDNNKNGTLTGNLTLHGVTKPVTLEVSVNKIGMSPVLNKKTVGFSAKGTIKRSDFGIKSYLPGVGDDVNLVIETEANL